MTSSEFFSLLSAISLFSIAVALVPTFLQFRRTLRKTEIFVESLNTHVDPLCTSLTEAANEIQLLAVSLNDKIDKTDEVIYTAQKSAEILLATSTMIKETASPLIAQIGGISAGVMAFANFITRAWKTHK